MDATQTMILTNEMIKRHVSLDEVISCVENTWRWHGENKVIMPSKITTDMRSAGVDGWFNAMPSYIAPLDMAGIKVVGGYGGNTAKGLPYIRSNLLLTDPHTGFLYALACGDWISDARTGAQPAIAIKYLAAKTDILTIIGAGRQAFYAISCIGRVHKLKEVRVCDISETARNRFASYFPDADFTIIPCADTEAACKDADIMITLTTANAVLIKEPWCKPGCLVLTMGSYQEADDDIARKFDKLYLDHIAQGLHRGQFLGMASRGEIGPNDFAAELTEVAAGLKKGRDNPEQRIMAQLVGMGSPDLAVATLAYRRILESDEAPVSLDMLG